WYPQTSACPRPPGPSDTEGISSEQAAYVSSISGWSAVLRDQFDSHSGAYWSRSSRHSRLGTDFRAIRGIWCPKIKRILQPRANPGRPHDARKVPFLLASALLAECREALGIALPQAVPKMFRPRRGERAQSEC